MSEPETDELPEITVVEAFGADDEPFECAICGASRIYSDTLSDGRKVCLECSVKGGFQPDLRVIVHGRDPVLLAQDPELIEIRNSLVRWEIETSGITLENILVPQDVAERLLGVSTSENVSLDVVITAGLRMLFSAYDTLLQQQEVEPVLPEQAVSE